MGFQQKPTPTFAYTLHNNKVPPKYIASMGLKGMIISLFDN